MIRLGLGLIWLLHFLPARVLALVGSAVGALLYMLAQRRRNIVLINLKLCFPQWTEAQRIAVARRHFNAFARSIFDRGILWWGSEARVRRFVQVESDEHWRAVAQRPVILLAPHFVGLDMGGVRLSADFLLRSVFSRQKNNVADDIIIKARTRFKDSKVFARQDGIRPMIKSLKRGEPFYYLPDMDLGARDSVFAPFFGVQAATITGLSRIAQLSGAIIVPCVTRQLPGGRGYVARFYPAWEGFPSGDLQADAQRMNAFIEERVREMPEQYYWLHKRFKTRPPGEASPYE